jgi:hypothetical protein
MPNDSHGGNEPNQWKVVHFANVGTGEEFVEQFACEFPELIDATNIFDPQRQELKEAILAILIDGLIPAFEHLKKIRASVSQEMPTLNRMQLYEDFSRVLWHAYKGLMPKATGLLGFDIGFLFQNDVNFEKGAVEFNSKYHSSVGLCDHLREQRNNWQNGLKEFRNHLEHESKDLTKFAKYYDPELAEVLFDSAWRTMADLLPILIASHFSPSHTIAEIPVNERDPTRRRRFRHVLGGPIDLGTEGK